MTDSILKVARLQRAPLVPEGAVMHGSFPLAVVDQPSLLGSCAVTDAVLAMSKAGTEERGAIFTKREVVDFILDLAGYTPDRPLHTLRLVEPSFGDGDFLFPVIKRLMRSWENAGSPEPVASLSNAIRAVELNAASFVRTKAGVIARLIESGLEESDAQALASSWLLHADFLLAPLDGTFDFAVGNPPYVRQELIPDVLMAAYRVRYRTIYDRADLYIPFIERCLTLLGAGGHLGFICADRWMKNRYGGPLRKFVADSYNLKFYIDMTDTPAFHADVIAYPAVFVIAREKQVATRIAAKPEIEKSALGALAARLLDPAHESVGVRTLTGVVENASPWILESTDQLALIRRLERDFPTLEEAGCKVGIGVATGADRAYIADFESLDVEDDRKLPLAMTRDIAGGTVQWRGLGVINPFRDDGKLVDLSEYPKLRHHLESRRAEIASRHVAQKIPANWYRTIDRIYPELAAKPKLLIPDIKGEAQIVYEEGRLYPHHNLYFVTSEQWDLHALQAVLLSGIARLFVSHYSTKMRGGYLRFQAQYLRRIRIPFWQDVPVHLRRQLTAAGKSLDLAACNRLALELYAFAPHEQDLAGVAA